VDPPAPSPWWRIVRFVGIAFTLSWGIEIGLRPLDVPLGVRAVLAMFVPALTAAALRGPLCHEGFADAALGFRFRSAWRSYAAAYAVVPIALAAGAGVALLARVQHLDPAGNLAALIRSVGGTPAHASDSASMLWLAGLATLTVAVPVNCIFTFGEEFGWRGYLLPELTRVTNVPAAALGTGAIWGLWHAPLILLDGFNYPTNRVAGVALMVALCAAVSLTLSALRLASRSIWPSTIAHAALNSQAGIILVLLAPMFSLRGAPVGVAGIAVFAAIGIVVMRGFRADWARTGREP
jgi:membrane protease YdiL (CAAX protease family)